MQDSYLLAITPPADILEKISEYQEKYKKHAYSINPHITIYPPFYLREISEKDLLERISREMKNFPNEDIVLNSVAFFENGNDKNVAFFKPDDNSTDYLRKIFNACSNCIKDFVSDAYNDYSAKTEYNPHMTISSNIPDDVFQKIKSELENVRENFNFRFKSVDVYKQNRNSKIWTKLSS